MSPTSEPTERLLVAEKLLAALAQVGLEEIYKESTEFEDRTLAMVALCRRAHAFVADEPVTVVEIETILEGANV